MKVLAAPSASTSSTAANKTRSCSDVIGGDHTGTGM